MKLKYNPALYHRALAAYLGMSRLRADRSRLCNFTYGRQWSDPVTADDGRLVTEEVYALESGMRPLTNNLLRDST